jgi:maltose O-acetyltransferase
MKPLEKTEKQKMLAGELYLASDPELVTGRQRAYRLTQLYNTTTEEEQESRSRLLHELFGELGSGCQIVPSFYCDYGSNIYAGERFYMNYGCVILDCNTVEIGNDVLCAPYVQIYAAYHPTDPNLRLTGRELAAPVKIGNNVWIGGGAIICPGVTIGDNTTIGAGSVVVKSIPANVVAAGNPCRVIRSVESETDTSAPPAP